MFRLYSKAWKILSIELEKATAEDIAGEVAREIVSKRLNKLRNQKGKPLN